MKQLKQIDVESIVIDDGTQMRAAIDQDAVAEYAERLDELPPSVVFTDGAKTWLGDGFHRYHAHRKAGRKKMLCEVRKGTLRDATLFALGANADHGLRRTNADKNKAVETMLRDKEWVKWSNGKIAEACAVSEHMVRDARKRIFDLGEDAPAARTVQRGNQTYQMDTSRVGKSGPNTAVADSPPDPRQADVPPPEVKDEEGQVISHPKLQALWHRREEIQDMMTAVSKLRTAAERAEKTDDPLFVHLTTSQFKADCGNLYRALRFAKPHAVCPYCGGRGCKTCKKTGLVGETIFKNYTPEDLKV